MQRHAYGLLCALAVSCLSAEARAQRSVASGRLAGADVEFVPPCVRTGEQVSCWGPHGGGLALARVPELAGVTGLVTSGDGVCGIRGTQVVCHPARDMSTSRARLLSHDGHLGCTIDLSGAVRCEGEVEATPRGRVVSVLWDELSCNGVRGSRAIVLHGDGHVSADGCDEPWHRALRDVVQMEGVDGLFCTRTRAGAIACVERDYSSHLAPSVLTSFDGRLGYTDMAVSYQTVCALDPAGVVSCASPERVRLRGRPGSGVLSTGRVQALPHTGVRAIAFYRGTLCLLDDAGVLCDGLPEMLGVAVEVAALPPVRSAALSTNPTLGCAIDRQDALYCWDGDSAPVRTREGVLAVALEEAGTRFTLDAAGALVVEGDRGRGRASLPGFWRAAPREVSLSIGSAQAGMFVCAAAADEVRCAELRMRGVRPEALVPIDAVTEEQRALVRWRDRSSELDEAARWWFHDTRWMRDTRLHLRDDIVWTMGGRVHDTRAAIDRDGRLWVTSNQLHEGVAGPTGRSGTWARISPSPGPL